MTHQSCEDLFRDHVAHCSTPVASLRQLIKGWEIWLLSNSLDAQALEVNCSTVMFCFIVPSFLSWGSDISAFNNFHPAEAEAIYKLCYARVASLSSTM